MGSRKKSKSSKSFADKEGTFASDEEAFREEQTTPSRPPLKPATAEQPPQRPIHSQEKRITVEAFARSKTLGHLFLVEQKLKHGVRKLTLKEWEEEYERFLTAPRR